MALYGLILIAAAWAFQFLSITSKDTKINPIFLAFYSLGVLIVVFNSLTTGIDSLALLNLISALFPLAILIKIHK